MYTKLTSKITIRDGIYHYRTSKRLTHHCALHIINLDIDDNNMKRAAV